MKKIALTLAFLLTLCSFTACGDDSSSESKSNSSSVETTTEAATEAETEAETTEEAAESTTAAEEEATTKADSEGSDKEAAEGNGLTRGKVEGNVYTSEFAGIKFTAPEGWTFAKDDYILSMMNISFDTIGDDIAINKALLDQAVIYDALCMDQKTGANIIFEYENLAKEVPDPDKYTMDDIIASFDKQLAAITAIKYEKIKADKVTIAGQEYEKLVYHADYNTISMDQVFYIRREGDLVFCIIASNGQSGEDMTVYEKNIEALN